MSHASGITASQDLVSQFASVARNGGARLLQVVIQNEKELIIQKSVQPKGSWEQDFDLTSGIVTDKDACYILYRTDEKNSEGAFLFWLIRYVPDRSRVRDKMLYASTVSQLKSALGDRLFVTDLQGTIPSDINCAGYRSFLEVQSAAVPLTDAEQQRQEELEGGEVFVGGGGASMSSHGVDFPVDADVMECLGDFVSGNINYVQLDVDVKQEKIILSDALTITVADVPNHIDAEFPRFHFFRYHHVRNGAPADSFVFIYSCPDGSGGTKSAPVKHRMLFSSSKANVASLAEKAGFSVQAKLEINSPSDFSEQEIVDLIYPPQAETQNRISKPKPQAKRRLIK